jgi:hypothetical protein
MGLQRRENASLLQEYVLRNREIKYNLRDSMRDLRIPLLCKWYLRFLRFYAA